MSPQQCDDCDNHVTNLHVFQSTMARSPLYPPRPLNPLITHIKPRGIPPRPHPSLPVTFPVWHPTAILCYEQVCIYLLSSPSRMEAPQGGYYHSTIGGKKKTILQGKTARHDFVLALTA